MYQVIIIITYHYIINIIISSVRNVPVLRALTCINSVNLTIL